MITLFDPFFLDRVAFKALIAYGVYFVNRKDTFSGDLVKEEEIMGYKCPKCGYERQSEDLVPEYECPKCGVIYKKAEKAIFGDKKLAIDNPPESPKKTKKRKIKVFFVETLLKTVKLYVIALLNLPVKILTPVVKAISKFYSSVRQKPLTLNLPVKILAPVVKAILEFYSSIRKKRIEHFFFQITRIMALMASSIAFIVLAYLAFSQVVFFLDFRDKTKVSFNEVNKQLEEKGELGKGYINAEEIQTPSIVKDHLSERSIEAIQNWISGLNKKQQENYWINLSSVLEQYEETNNEIDVIKFISEYTDIKLSKIEKTNKGKRIDPYFFYQIIILSFFIILTTLILIMIAIERNTRIKNINN